MRKLLTGLMLISGLFLTACAATTAKNTAQAALEKTFWILSSVADKTYNPPAGVRLVAIQMDGNQRLVGFLGCNNLTGSYTLSGSDGISFRGASTRMMCMGDGMQYENRLSQALSSTNRYQLSKGKLMLYKDDALLATFVTKQ